MAGTGLYIPTCDISFSILNFNTEERTLSLLDHIVEMVHQNCRLHHLSYSFVIRDNSPLRSTKLKDVVKKFSEEKYSVSYVESANIGFGMGHNWNFALTKSRIFCVMNNDMGFPHVDWLNDVIQRLTDNPQIGAIGLEGENFSLNPQFGYANRVLSVNNRTYLDGSLLFFNSDAYRAMDGFDESYGLAYFEDTDISLRLRSAGYALETAEMPHEHFRSSSTSKFPASFYSALYEKGRSVFFARWGGFLESGICNNRVLILCNHDGLGDFFLALYPLREYLRRCRRIGFSATVQIKFPDLAFLLSDIEGVEIIFTPPVDRSVFGHTVKLAGLNMALPFLSLDLYAAQLGVIEFEDDPTELRHLLAQAYRAHDQGLDEQKQSIVCHFDNTRQGFAGRVLGRSAAREVLDALVSGGRNVVLIGAPDRAGTVDEAYEKFISETPEVKDLRGKTSMTELIGIVASARKFIGIDSGPANIAQVFNVESLIIFGSTLPDTKVYRANVATFSNAALSCLGCYHTNVEYAYSTCHRIDEACVKGINASSLRLAVLQFLSGSTVRNLVAPAYKTRLREHLMQLIYNPVYKSKSYSLSGFLGKNFSDTFIEVADIISRRAISDAEGMRDTAFSLDDENRKLKVKIKEYEKFLKFASKLYEENDGKFDDLSSKNKNAGLSNSNVADSAPDQNRGTKLRAFELVNEDGFAGCDGKIDGDKINIIALNSDPQVILRPVFVKGAPVVLEVTTKADRKTKFKIYWGTNQNSFHEHNSVSFDIGSTPQQIKWNAPVGRGDVLYLRIDPADTQCNAEFTVSLVGEVGFDDRSRFGHMVSRFFLGGGTRQ